MPQKLTPWQRPHVSMASLVRSQRLQRAMQCSLLFSPPKARPAFSGGLFPEFLNRQQLLVSESSVDLIRARSHGLVWLGRMRARRAIAVRALLLVLCATTPAQLRAATKNVVCEQQSDCTVPG